MDYGVKYGLKGCSAYAMHSITPPKEDAMYIMSIIATSTAIVAVLVIAFLVLRKRDEESIKRGLRWG